VLRATTAPVHERAAFIGFVLAEIVSASSQFWYSIFGEGRTFIDASVMAAVLLLATPRKITNKHLAWLATVAVVALIVVARRRILFE
jgi:hypothetical protein